MERIQLKMMHASFIGNSFTTCVFCYTPINATDETDTITLSYLPLSNIFPNTTI